MTLGDKVIRDTIYGCEEGLLNLHTRVGTISNRTIIDTKRRSLLGKVVK